MIPIFLSIGLGALTVLAQNSYADNICTVASLNGTSDDSPAISSAFAKCASGGTVVFEEGIDYNVFTPISATNLTDVTIQMYGNLHLPQDIEATRKLVLSKSSNTYWFTLKGSGVHWEGAKSITSGWVNSYGQPWWDANPANGTGITGRPHLMSFDVEGGSITRFRSRKPIAWNVKIEGSDIDISDSIVDAVSNSQAFPFNTDAFDVGAQNVRITNLEAFNGDDAVAINNGAHNVYVSDSTIGYQTHGLSIGSLGKDQSSFANVSNIRFDRISVAGGLYAARFKSWVGGQGLCSNVTWSNIKIHNVTFPVFINQQYVDQGSAGSAERPNNSSVVLKDFTFENFTGDINSFHPGDGSCATDPCWYDIGLPDLTQTEAMIIECNTNSSCSGFKSSNIDIYPQKQQAPTVICMNAGAELNPELGFECANGTFAPTQ